MRAEENPNPTIDNRLAEAYAPLIASSPWQSLLKNQHSSVEPFRGQIEHLGGYLANTLGDQGAALLLNPTTGHVVPRLLANTLDPIAVGTEPVGGSETLGRQTWHLVGLHLLSQCRLLEAFGSFERMYHHILRAQTSQKRWLRTGAPLVRMADILEMRGCPALAKRYQMLTLCDDAIALQGDIVSRPNGSFIRLREKGLSDETVQRYASEIAGIASSNRQHGYFPEGVLLHLSDQDWMTEVPGPAELGAYRANPLFVRFLRKRLGAGDGKALEELGDYLLSSLPGCRTRRRVTGNTGEYDLICSFSAAPTDFFSEIGQYFLCECKDWSAKPDYPVIAVFCRRLDAMKARFGVLLARKPLTGPSPGMDARGERQKVFQDRGIVIAALDDTDLDAVEAGQSLPAILRRKYEEVRLDLPRRSGLKATGKRAPRRVQAPIDQKAEARGGDLEGPA